MQKMQKNAKLCKISQNYAKCAKLCKMMNSITFAHFLNLHSAQCINFDITYFLKSKIA